MNYQDVEEAIASYLGTKLGANVDVYSLPDTVEEYSKTVTRPRVTVAYFNSDFAKPAGIFGYQNEKAMFRLIVQSKTRKSTTGVFAVAANVLKFSVGQKFTPFGEMYLHNILLEEYNQKAKEWTYVITVAAETIFVKDIPESGDVDITQITMQSSYNSSDIP